MSRARPGVARLRRRRASERWSAKNVPNPRPAPTPSRTGRCDVPVMRRSPPATSQMAIGATASPAIARVLGRSPSVTPTTTGTIGSDDRAQRTDEPVRSIGEPLVEQDETDEPGESGHGAPTDGASGPCTVDGEHEHDGQCGTGEVGRQRDRDDSCSAGAQPSEEVGDTERARRGQSEQSRHQRAVPSSMGSNTARWNSAARSLVLRYSWA